MDESEFSKYVALDAEYTRIVDPDKRIQTEPTQVAITDISGKVLFNEYFFLKNRPVIPMAKKRFAMLQKNAKRTYEAARNEVLSILRGKIVVGHDLAHDFTAMNINPVKDGLAGVIDSAKLPLFKKADPVGYPIRPLQNLAEEFLQRKIQQSHMHDAAEDAKASANLIRTTFPYLNAPMPVTRQTLAAAKVIADYGRRMGIAARTEHVNSAVENLKKAAAKAVADYDRRTVAPAAPAANMPNLLRFEPVKSAAEFLKEMEDLEMKKSMEMYLSEMEGLNMRRTANNYLREMEGLNVRKTAKNYLREMEGLNMSKPGINHFAELVTTGGGSRRKTRRRRRA